MESITAAQEAVLAGKTVHWHSQAYTLIQSQTGEWLIKCYNGYITPLNRQKPADFFIAADTANQKISQN